MDEHIKLIIFKKNRYWCVLERSKRDSVTRIAKKKKVAGPMYVKFYTFHPLLNEVES
jgi:hypothetical protein